MRIGIDRGCKSHDSYKDLEHPSNNKEIKKEQDQKMKKMIVKMWYAIFSKHNWSEWHEMIGGPVQIRHCKICPQVQYRHTRE